MVPVSKAKLLICLLVLPFMREVSGAAAAADAVAVGSRSWHNKQHVIRFYNKGDKYYAFTNFFHLAPACHRLVIDQLQWPSSEHYFQARKFHTQQAIFDQIRNATSAHKAFDIAKQYQSYVRSDWHQSNERGVATKEYVMLEAVYQKFFQNKDLRQLLLDTGNSILVEDSPVDRYWGCGQDGCGENKLGRALMYVREWLRTGTQDSSYFMRGAESYLDAAPSVAAGYPGQLGLFSRLRNYLYSCVGNLFVRPVRGIVSCVWNRLRGLLPVRSTVGIAVSPQQVAMQAKTVAAAAAQAVPQATPAGQPQALSWHSYKINKPLVCDCREKAEFNAIVPGGITIINEVWPSAYHYYNAQKFVGTALYERIKAAPSVDAVATLVKEHKEKVRTDWTRRNARGITPQNEAMIEALSSKLVRVNTDPEKWLFASRGQTIVDNSCDQYWGTDSNGYGENQLGQIVMYIRYREECLSVPKACEAYSPRGIAAYCHRT